MSNRSLDSKPQKGSNHYKNGVFVKLGNKCEDECILPNIATKSKLPKLSHECDGYIRYSTIEYKGATLVNTQPMCAKGVLFLVSNPSVKIET